MKHEEGPGRTLQYLQRHVICAAASIALLSTAFFFMSRRGVLGDLAPADIGVHRLILVAFAVTFVLFFPFALLFDWLCAKKHWPAWSAPLTLFILFTAFWLFVESAWGTLNPTIAMQYAVFAGYVAMAFCGYWIPLRFFARR